MKLSKERFDAYSGEGRYVVEGTANRTGNGVAVLIVGGEKPHIGAVAIAVPRPSLKGRAKISATCSVYTLLGHKDDEVAKPAAERLASELREVTVVIAGIHVNNASKKEISTLVGNAEKVVQELLRKMK